MIVRIDNKAYSVTYSTCGHQPLVRVKVAARSSRGISSWRKLNPGTPRYNEALALADKYDGEGRQLMQYIASEINALREYEEGEREYSHTSENRIAYVIRGLER